MFVSESNFAPPKFYGQIVDYFDYSTLLPEDIIVVSRQYAEVAKYKLPAYLADRLFVPDGLVYDFEGNICGCTTLTKAAAFQVPSFYITVSTDNVSKKLALKYWQNNWNCLDQNELAALSSLEMMCNNV